MFLALLVAFLVIFVAFYLQRSRKYKVLDEYPGPSSWEIIKFMVSPKTTVGAYNFLVSLTEKYGKVVKIWLKPFQPTLVVADEKFLKHIFLSKEHVHKGQFFVLLEPLIGNGLASMSELNHWRNERKKLAQVFNTQVVTEYTSMFKKHAMKLSSEVKKNLNEPVDLQRLLLRATLSIVYELMVTENYSERYDQVEGFMECVRNFFHVYFDRIHSFYKMNDLLYKLTSDFNIWTKSSVDSKEFLESAFNRIVEMKRKSADKSAEKDFLDLLLETGLTEQRILEHFRTFAVAGADTVACTVSFALYELAKNPDMQEKLYNEYITVMGGDENIFPEFRDVQKMTYTECVVKESMRMHPPVPLLYRRLGADSEIDGKTFPNGLEIIVSVIGSHTMNFENPSQFDPERFLPENSHKLPAHGYIPFALGPRDCIGKVFGLVESKYLLSYIMRHFTVHPIKEAHQLELAGEIVLNSKTDVPVIFRERTQ